MLRAIVTAAAIGTIMWKLTSDSEQTLKDDRISYVVKLSSASIEYKEMIESEGIKVTADLFAYLPVLIVKATGDQIHDLMEKFSFIESCEKEQKVDAE